MSINKIKIWKVSNRGYSRLVFARNNKEAKQNAIDNINVYTGNAPPVRDVEWEYKEGNKLTACKALIKGAGHVSTLKTFCSSMEKVHNWAITSDNLSTRQHWLNCGHGKPQSLKQDNWENNPSFSEFAYQEHFGFPSQPGYYQKVEAL